MDSIRSYNERRWDALAAGDALFTRPRLDLNEDLAKAMVDPLDLLGSLRGRPVLCLASGGGQQSAAFGVLGAHVTVVDVSNIQLARDRVAAEAYGYGIETIHADMRDLSCLGTRSFDLVYHPYSINFVPDPTLVFAGVARVLKPHGFYFVVFANPIALGVSARSWNGAGYPVHMAYEDPGPVETEDPLWVYPSDSPRGAVAPPPREFRHTLACVLNGLSTHGLVPVHLTEHLGASEHEDPGSWAHFTRVLPPWYDLWTRFNPEIVGMPPTLPRGEAAGDASTAEKSTDAP